MNEIGAHGFDDNGIIEIEDGEEEEQVSNGGFMRGGKMEIDEQAML